MTFTLTITLGNDAMQTPGDVSLALSELAEKFRNNGEPFEGSDLYDRNGRIRDLNGNTVGTWRVR